MHCSKKHELCTFISRISGSSIVKDISNCDRSSAQGLFFPSIGAATGKTGEDISGTGSNKVSFKIWVFHWKEAYDHKGEESEVCIGKK